MHRIKALGHDVYDLLVKGEVDLYGELLHEHWQNKRRLASKMSDERLDEYYDVARRAGAIGGKLIGAGGGGFFMLYVRPAEKRAVLEALSARGLRPLRFGFDLDGAKIVANLSAPRPLRLGVLLKWSRVAPRAVRATVPAILGTRHVLVALSEQAKCGRKMGLSQGFEAGDSPASGQRKRRLGSRRRQTFSASAGVLGGARGAQAAGERSGVRSGIGSLTTQRTVALPGLRSAQTARPSVSKNSGIEKRSVRGK